MTASMGMEAAIRRRLTRRRWRTFHPLLNSLVQGKGGRRDTSPVKRASTRLPRFFLFFCSPRAAFLLSPVATARKQPCPRRSPIDFDRLPRPPLKQLRPHGGIHERRNNKTHKQYYGGKVLILLRICLSFAKQNRKGSLVFSRIINIAKHHITLHCVSC